MTTGAGWLQGMKELEGSYQEKQSRRIPEHKKSPAMKCADIRRRVGLIFGQDAVDCVEIHPSFGATIDPFKLEAYLAKKHSDFPKDDEANPDAETDSVMDFLVKHYGQEVANWVEASI